MIFVRVACYFRVINGAYCHKNHEWTREGVESQQMKKSTIKKEN